MSPDLEQQLLRVGRKLKEARKRILALESQGIKINIPKHLRRFLDKGKDKA